MIYSGWQEVFIRVRAQQPTRSSNFLIHSLWLAAVHVPVRKDLATHCIQGKGRKEFPRGRKGGRGLLFWWGVASRFRFVPSSCKTTMTTISLSSVSGRVMVSAPAL